MDGYGSHTYGDAFADVYDDWYAEVTDAAATADRVAELVGPAGGPVLELGIGSGRIALALADRGLKVWGVDASEAMVALLAAKPGGAELPVAVTDMASLDLSGLPGGAEVRFSVVLAAFNTFFNLVTEQDQHACLSRVAEVLEPGGRFLIEAVVPDPSGPASGVEARTVALDRVVLLVSRRDPDGHTVRGQTVELSERNGVRLRPWMLRTVLPDELDEMALQHGLSLEERWAGWDRTPFQDGGNDALHISMYRRR